jgi:hypothetical protein
MAFPSTPPRTQYDRNLTIRLSGGGSTVVFTFPIKPSEFNIDHPARVTTTQTLQGVYQDFGGLGVPTITYQGNTGWRRRSNNDANGELDGFGCFRKLYDDIYKEYHNRISASDDPADIECLVIDDLYDTAYQVSLDDFQATKSKANPLLYNYVIRMTVQSMGSRDLGYVRGKDLTELPAVSLDANNIPLSLSEVLNNAGVYMPYAEGSFRHYTVLSGDNLESISFMYFGTKNKAMSIANLNGIASPFMFDPGISLLIPW